MDNTELHYVTYDPDAIYEEMQVAYVEAGGDVLYPGDEKEMLLRAMQSVIVQVFAGVDNALRMDTLRYAVGDYLDVYGEKRGCERLQRTQARAKVRVTFKPVGKSGTMAAGTALTADGEVTYLTDEDVQYTGMAQDAEVGVTCARYGSVGNGLTAGQAMQTLAAYDNIGGVVCVESATGGMEREDDDTYRERIRTYGLANVTTGTKEAYERVAKEVSKEIIDAHAVQLAPGSVGVYLILASATGAEALVESVRQALSADTARPLTDSVTVAQASKKVYDLRISYTADASKQNAIAEAVNEYKAWQETVVGRAYNPDMLVSFLYQAGAMRVRIDAGSTFAGGSGSAYTEIGETEYCTGTVSLAVIA